MSAAVVEAAFSAVLDTNGRASPVLHHGEKSGGYVASLPMGKDTDALGRSAHEGDPLGWHELGEQEPDAEPAIAVEQHGWVGWNEVELVVPHTKKVSAGGESRP